MQSPASCLHTFQDARIEKYSGGGAGYGAGGQQEGRGRRGHFPFEVAPFESAFC
jgi:hypothetical protein